MRRDSTCPTCGTQTQLLERRVAWRRCNACQRNNPRGFLYCGFCANPMENTELRARISELMAPEGGWPSLSRELIELRFFLEQGQLDDADEFLAVLNERYPGHPELAAFCRSDRHERERDIASIVDEVLASSSTSFAGPAPRRRAPRWQSEATNSLFEAEKRVPSEPDADRSSGDPVSSKSSEATQVYQALVPPRYPVPLGMTMVVESLQPPAPFRGAVESGETRDFEDEPTLESRAEEPKAADEEGRPTSASATATRAKRPSVPNRHRKLQRFGANVLGRWGR